MFEKAKSGRDAFTFSLGGIKTVASFTFAPAIADDRINKIRDAHLKLLEARRREAAEPEKPTSAVGADLCAQTS